MRNRASKLIIASLMGFVLVGAAVLPAGSAPKGNLGSFVGTAGSHAVKISIGDLVLTVGGGESRAGYQRTKNSPVQILDRLAKATARGVVIPGLADTSATCAPPKLADEVAALTTPDELKPLLSLQLGVASCALGGMKELPSADHGAGEVLAEVRLTDTIVSSVPDLNEFLTNLEGTLAPLPAELRGSVTSAIDQIQQQLASHPLLRVSVAPNRGTVRSTEGGIGSVAPGTAVVVDVLGGLVRLDIAVAEASASIADGNPTAAADVSFVRVRALNILTPDPNDALIDQKISAPQDLSLLEGTPLETSIVTERGIASTSCEGQLASYNACASGTADAVALSLLASPLPNIGVELVHTEVLAAGNIGAPTTPVKKNNPVLPKTGAGVAGVVVSGLVLAFGGIGLRRRLAR